MLMSLKRDYPPAMMSCLQYGNSGPSCQQVCLVSDPDGEKFFTGVTFLSLFSKYLASLLKDNRTLSEVPTIILPVPVNILKQLLNFLCTGEVICKDIEDAFSLGKAADVLGISNEDWKIETEFKGESNVKFARDTAYMFGKESQFKGSDLSLPVVIEGTSPTPQLQYSNLRIKDVFSLSKDNDVLDNSNEDRKIEEIVKGVKFGFENYFVDPLSLQAVNGDIASNFQLESRKFRCDICGKSYTSRGVLIAHHIFQHSQLSPLICKECPICKKTVNFVKKATDLGDHINQHFKEERKFQCDKCPKSFLKNRHLAAHRKIKHTKIDHSVKG